MKERPIIFSGEMVRAILDRRKTQTRRVIKPQPDLYHGRGAYEGQVFWAFCKGRKVIEDSIHSDWPDCLIKYCPYGQPGDRLWVKENAQISPKHWGDKLYSTHYDYDMDHRVVSYCADYKSGRSDAADDYGIKITPSIFMPRWASRILLEVTARRAERLQEISEEDAIAEGIKNIDYPWGAVGEFATLWNSINAKRGYPWKNNDWVWVIELKRLETKR